MTTDARFTPPRGSSSTNPTLVVLFLLAAVLLVVGIAAGSTGVTGKTTETTIKCGSVFSPNSSDASSKTEVQALTNDLVGSSDYGDQADFQAVCDTARSSRKTVVYGGVGLGVLTGAMALAVSATRRRTT
jgi:hypothetical protein